MTAILELDPARVKPMAGQPRKRFRGIKQLAESIRLVGQVTPIIVTPCDEDGYDAELVDGERRLRACLLGAMRVKALLDDGHQNGAAVDRYVRSVAANFCRQPHDAIEIMEAVLLLKSAGKSTEEIAGIFGKTVSWVFQHASLARLAPEVREALKIAGDEAKLTKKQTRARGRMTFSVALLLVPLRPEKQIKAMRLIMAGKMGIAEARTAVHKMARSTGVQVGTHTSPSQKFAVIRNAADVFHFTLERYVRMPAVEIAAVLRAASRSEKAGLAKRLEDVCDNLLMLADELAKKAES